MVAVVVVICLSSLVSSASFGLQWSSGGCFIVFPLVGGYFATVLLWRMLCHLCCVVDLYTLGVFVSFSRFNCGRIDLWVYIYLPRFSCCTYLLSPVTYLVVLCIYFNSLCLLRFCNDRIVFLLIKYVLRHVRGKKNVVWTAERQWRLI